MDQQLLEFLPNLKCPLTHSDLHVMNKVSLDLLNARIRERKVHHADGSPVKESLTDALVSDEYQLVYPVIDGKIAALMENLAILPEDKSGLGEILRTLDEEKLLVQGFYEEYGWHKADGKKYHDTVDFEDHRKIASAYWSRCHLRLNRYLRSGKYILDVASGAIPNDEYLSYSQNYQLRICMDFSLLALKEAAVRLHGKGIFIMGDMTNIPIKDDCMDAVISLHTVYHVPKKEQTKAVEESHRILKDKGVAVIVYSWQRAPLMHHLMGGWRKLMKLKNRNAKIRKKEGEQPAGSSPKLHTYQQNFSWYDQVLRHNYGAQLKVYSAISRSFSHTFIRKKFFGKQLAAFIYWLEDQLPGILGKYGQYPVFVLEKQPVAASASRQASSVKKNEQVTF
ncbi:MAG: class I SAM-dependent methyltransferase [Cyclobacteriaceae bacterium]